MTHYEDIFPKYKQLKARFMKIGLAIPGTIRETYLFCGKKKCACATKSGSPHGPYHFWNHKINGKLTTKSIPKHKLSLYERWINNRREFEKLMRELLDFGQKIANNLPPEKRVHNSKKRGAAKCGK